MCTIFGKKMPTLTILNTPRLKTPPLPPLHPH